MEFHESFWVAVAAAAPVIALANTVSVIDAVNAWLTTPVRRRSDLAQTIYFVVFVGGAAAFGTEACMLLVALLSLSAKEDFFYASQATLFLMLGFLYTFILVAVDVILRYQLRKEVEVAKTEKM